MTEGRATATVPRLVELDALRGFALGGILLVNMTVMAGPGGFPDGFALDLLDAVFRNKFYVLFSFLFGYSLTMQFRSAERAAASARARTVRRCLALMAIGAAHAVFFFTGDVLFGYGAVGLVLLALSRIRPRTALWVAGVVYSVGAVILGVVAILAVGGVDRDPQEHERGMAATAYITQSVLTAVIFTGYGFALAGHLSDWTIIAVALTIYAAQLMAARIWVQHYRYGPIELFLRTVTYGPRHIHRAPATAES